MNTELFLQSGGGREGAKYEVRGRTATVWGRCWRARLKVRGLLLV
jgi:hypothetical protein